MTDRTGDGPPATPDEIGVGANPVGLLGPQVLRDWRVASQCRLVGRVYNHPEHVDGVVLRTSPVICVQFKGAGKIPVAWTQSGSEYWLDAPHASFAKAAAGFIAAKSSAAQASAAGQVSTPHTIKLRTVMLDLDDLADAGDIQP